MRKRRGLSRFILATSPTDSVHSTKTSSSNLTSANDNINNNNNSSSSSNNNNNNNNNCTSSTEEEATIGTHLLADKKNHLIVLAVDNHGLCTLHGTTHINIVITKLSFMG